VEPGDRFAGPHGTRTLADTEGIGILRTGEARLHRRSLIDVGRLRLKQVAIIRGGDPEGNWCAGPRGWRHSLLVDRDNEVPRDADAQHDLARSTNSEALALVQRAECHLLAIGGHRDPAGVGGVEIHA